MLHGLVFVFLSSTVRYVRGHNMPRVRGVRIPARQAVILISGLRGLDALGAQAWW